MRREEKRKDGVKAQVNEARHSFPIEIVPHLCCQNLASSSVPFELKLSFNSLSHFFNGCQRQISARRP